MKHFRLIAVLGVLVIFTVGVLAMGWIAYNGLQEETRQAQSQVTSLEQALEQQRDDYRALVKHNEEEWGLANKAYGELKANPITIEKIVYQDRIVEIKGWDTLAELRAFLANDDTDKTRFVSSPSAQGLCWQYAFQLMSRAIDKGKYLSFQLIDAGEYLRWYGEPLTGFDYHLVNMAIIYENGKNQLYLIEPQDDRVWLATPIN